MIGNSLTQAKEADARHNIREILEQLLLIPDVKETARANGKQINLRFAADGRRTSKICTVMAVFSILDEKLEGIHHVTISTPLLCIMVRTCFQNYIISCFVSSSFIHV